MMTGKSHDREPSVHAAGAGPTAQARRPTAAQGQVVHLQRAAGNRAVVQLVGGGPIVVQRAPTALSGLKRASGLAKKASAAEQAQKAGMKARRAKLVTVADLEKQVSVLEAATRKLVKAHKGGSAESQMAAHEVQRAAKRILGNLPDQKSKGSQVLGRTYPQQVKRLGRVVDDTQLILDEVRVETTRRQAEQVYLEAGRPAAAGHKGALTKLATPKVFEEKLGDRPKPNQAVLDWMTTNGYRDYDEAFDAVLAKTAANPSTNLSAEEARLDQAQPGLFAHVEAVRSRQAAAALGLSSAELAAIQTYTGQDYLYINPATANAPEWMKATFKSPVDKQDRTEEEEQALQDSLAKSGQTLDQRQAERRAELTARREEGGLHAGMAMQGLLKMPVWKGTAYRGQRMKPKQFYAQFVKDKDGFRPRNQRFDWKSITSISKARSTAEGFSLMGEGDYAVVFEMDVTNGRDIEGLSVNRREREVAILPGAQFRIDAVEVLTRPGLLTLWRLTVKCTQVN